jgi:hypothetical protein
MPRQLARTRVPVTTHEEDEPDEASSPSTEEAPAGRRSRRAKDDDTDETPARSRSSQAKAKTKVKASGGWTAVTQNRQAKYANPGRLQVKDKEVLVKFVEPEPFATYGQHWVGQRSYTCGLNADYGKCPLCDIGNPVRYLALFNVVDMESAENRYWEVGPEATKTLMEYADEDERTSPLDREGQYFTAKRFKKDNGFYGFKISTVKDRDLQDEFGTEPLEDDELSTALGNLFDDQVIPVNTIAELRGAAKEDDDED